jgi:antitoxin YefM
MKTITATEAKKRLLELIRDADESFERYFITRNSEPKAVLMSIDDYEGWLETLEILSSKGAVKEIRKARRELDAGKGIPFQKILGRLRG